MAAQKNSTLADRLYRLDLDGCLFLNKYCRQAAVNQFFSTVSRLGDGVFWYSLGAVLPVIYGMKGLAVTALFAATGIICLSIYKSLKARFYRARPFVQSKDIFKGCAPLDVCSFPSGHTMHACCFTTLVLWYFPEFAVVLLPFTILIAISRMVLGLHYPSDVVIGALLGTSLAIGACLTFDHYEVTAWFASQALIFAPPML